MAAGVSYRLLDYWARIGLVAPSLRSDADPPRRLYSIGDIVMLNLLRRLLKGGCSLRSFRPVMLTLRNLPDLAAATIVSDGNTVTLCRTADESADLLGTNQAVLTVDVRDVVAEVNDVLATFPAAPPGIDLAHATPSRAQLPTAAIQRCTAQLRHESAFDIGRSQ